LSWSPAPHWATISYVALSTSASTGAGDIYYFVLDSSKGKSTGSDLWLACKGYYNLVSVLRRFNLGCSPAPHWATISYVALSTSTSTGAGDIYYFVWDSSKSKSTSSALWLAYKRYYNLVSVLRRFNLG
jgi:catechol-2,3-dioxygenase